MKLALCLLMVLSLLGPFQSFLVAQSQYGNWVYRNATDTTIVRCWNDSLSSLSFPAGSMGMGMMYPDSVFCQFRFLPLDSLRHPIDSTFLCWRRIQIGSDSLHFAYMHCDSGYGTNNYMMGFMNGIACRLGWDSSLVDSLHRMWRPTGVRCWNGSTWITPSNVSISSTIVAFSTSELYAAIAIVGAPSGATGAVDEAELPRAYSLDQNYPNPFNPTTTIGYALPQESQVKLTVYNLLGQEVRSLVSGGQGAGLHSVGFSAGDLPSGVYFYRLQASSQLNHGSTFSDVRRMIFLK